MWPASGLHLCSGAWTVGAGHRVRRMTRPRMAGACGGQPAGGGSRAKTGVHLHDHLAVGGVENTPNRLWCLRHRGRNTWCEVDTPKATASEGWPETSTSTAARCQMRRSGIRRAPRLTRRHERSPAVDGDNDPPVTQYRHGVPDSAVGNSVLFGEAPLAAKLHRDLAIGDPPLDVVRNLDIRIFGPKRINGTSCHTINIDRSLSCRNLG